MKIRTLRFTIAVLHYVYAEVNRYQIPTLSVYNFIL